MRLHGPKKLLYSKGTVKRRKREPAEWETIFASYTFERKVVSTIYIDLKRSKKKSNNATREPSQEMSREFSKDEIQMVNKHVENVQPHHPGEEKKMQIQLH